MNWFVWSAGNRVQDRAAVHEMPSPLANRFLHVELNESIEDFKLYGYSQGFDPTLLAFLSFRPNYLHQPKIGEMAWPSPRTCQMANQLLSGDLPINSAVGDKAASEYETYCRLLENLPDIEAIVTNNNPAEFPEDPSVAWAVITALVVHANSDERAFNALKWLIDLFNSTKSAAVVVAGIPNLPKPLVELMKKVGIEPFLTCCSLPISLQKTKFQYTLKIIPIKYYGQLLQHFSMTSAISN